MNSTHLAISPSSKQAVRKGSLIDQFARRAILERLSRIDAGQLEVRESGVPTTLVGESPQGGMALTIDIAKPSFYRRLVSGGSLAAGATYIDGLWSTDDLVELIRLFIRNEHALHSVDRGLVRWTRWIPRLWHKSRRNTVKGSKRNISEHYDLGNEFFELFLDDTMSYSAAVFPNSNASLHEASVHKLDRICRKLDLQPTDHLLEIGSGWGGLAIHAALNYGCRVTTTTISRKQFDLAQRRIEAAGVADKVTLLLKDYRHLEGRYDKLVSVEMIEAVGREHLPTYFDACSGLLKPDGLMLIQAITIPDQRYADYIRSVDFIQRYVFPGGCLPSVGAIFDSIRRGTDLRMLHFEELAPHYAQTLSHWRTRFFDRIAKVKRQGYSERFIRLWEYYLCYSEAAFRERVVGSAQIVLAKTSARHDLLSVSLPVASVQQ